MKGLNSNLFPRNSSENVGSARFFLSKPLPFAKKVVSLHRISEILHPLLKAFCQKGTCSMRLPLLSVGPWIFSVALGGWPLHPTISSPLERCSSGWRGTPGKRVNVKSVSGVRIPLSPREVLWNLVQRKSKKNVSIVTSMSYDTFLLYIIVLPEYV